MELARYLKAELILRDLRVEAEEPEEDETEAARLRRRWRAKERALDELVSLMERSGRVRNRTKLFKDLLERERKGSTAVGDEMAIPHVRSIHAREPVFCFARSLEGVEFFPPDGRPTRLFFCLAAPPYDSRIYLKTYRWIAHNFSEEWLKTALIEAADEHEIVRILRTLR